MKLIFLILFCSILNSNLHAQESSNLSEVTDSASDFESEMDLNLSSASFRTYSDINGNSVTDYSVRMTYQQEIERPYQFGGSLGFQSIASKTYIVAIAGITANSNDDFSRAWFANLAAGAKSVDELENNSLIVKQVVRLSGELNFGKRIPIRKHFNFKPYIGFTKSGKSGTEITVSILNFSVNW